MVQTNTGVLGWLLHLRPNLADCEGHRGPELDTLVTTSARIVSGVFSRALAQIGLGVALGAGLVGYLVYAGVTAGGRELVLAGLGVGAVLVVVGMIGCSIPVLRALRIQPTQALRANG